MENVLLFGWVYIIFVVVVFSVRYFGWKTFLIKVEAQRKWNEGANMISFIDIKNSYILYTLNSWPLFVNKCVHYATVCCHLGFASKSPANNSAVVVQLNYEGVQPLNVTIWVLLYAFAFATHIFIFKNST